ncbi:tautomerase family protein [Thalassomonas viridans]|uniref:Tautomerase family protein n=1 Tax=Thalassomonas viridans TaxID=137584 RepID=A0AAE9Z4V1_9GAMM|nr:tautomerase family protein [Thalassomonas viridans]WDE06079.1 tautomerase family protein [Thalassomonas viridans]
MPHINIKLFPGFTGEQQEQLVDGITRLFTSVMHCEEKAISIAMEPVSRESWQERVYEPEITAAKDLLVKKPGY